MQHKIHHEHRSLQLKVRNNEKLGMKQLGMVMNIRNIVSIKVLTA